LKAFTFGSCKNICGKESIDCSCESTCQFTGTCCSDYHECEYLLNNNIDKNMQCRQAIPNCDLCETFTNNDDPMIKGQITSFKCVKCRDGLFKRYGECLPTCPIGDKIVMPNRICISKQKCIVEGCTQCLDNNPSVCKTCFGGLFLYNNKCSDSCPDNLKADRITMSCLESENFAWNMVYPSKTTCKNKCGMDVNIAGGMDCSCNEICEKKGNCCQDYDELCTAGALGANPAVQGANPAVQGANPAVPGIKPEALRANPAVGANPAVQGANPAVPGAKPEVPGAKPAVPGAKPVVPGANPEVPGAKPVVPGLQGVNPVVPAANPTAPGVLEKIKK
jgi:hypothetical protein